MIPTDDLTPMLATLRSLEGAARSFSTVLAGGLKSAVVEGRALDEVLKGMVLRLSAQVLSRSLAPLGQLLGGLGGSLLGAVAGTSVTPFARGGVIASPTYFPLPPGGAGLAGEAGPEAILPLARGSDGRLGVRTGQGTGRPVTVTLNVTTPDADSFRRSEAQLSAMLARAAGRGRRGL